MKDHSQACTQKPGISEESNPDSFKKWVLGTIIVAAYIYLRMYGVNKFFDMVTHSRWWHESSEAKKDLVRGTFLMAMGGLWLHWSFRDLDEKWWNLFYAFCAGLLALVGLYELLAAAMLS